MAQIIVPDELLDIIRNTIHEYSLISKSDKIIVAYSGGKDSTFLLISLSQLGYNVIPVIVDVGYEDGWADSIAKYSKNIGFDPVIVDINDCSKKSNNKELELFKGFQQRVQFLYDAHHMADLDITPCTECYNIKLLLLVQFAIRNNINNIAFGHHGVDSVVSLLKSVFYYIDRWEMQNYVYHRKNFESIVTHANSIISSGFLAFYNSVLFKKISKLSKEMNVSTDEPPLTIHRTSYSDIRIIRPLFNVFENNILGFIKNNNISVDASFCGHGLTKQTQTPREMIHRRIFNESFNNDDSDLIFNLLLKECKNGLNIDGALIFDARRTRESKLGLDYKKNMGHHNKL